MDLNSHEERARTEAVMNTPKITIKNVRIQQSPNFPVFNPSFLNFLFTNNQVSTQNKTMLSIPFLLILLEKLIAVVFKILRGSINIFRLIFSQFLKFWAKGINFIRMIHADFFKISLP